MIELDVPLIPSQRESFMLLINNHVFQKIDDISDTKITYWRCRKNRIKSKDQGTYESCVFPKAINFCQMLKEWLG